MAFPHSENSRGVRHHLPTHLKCVAELAATFPAKFGAANLAYWAGPRHRPAESNARNEAHCFSAVRAARYNSPLGCIYVGT